MCLYSRKLTLLLTLLLFMSLVFSSCTGIIPSETTSITDGTHDTSRLNMVDERFELLALIWRLAERQEYSEKATDYQKELETAFAEFKSHPAVQFVREQLPYTGYDAVFKYAVHLTQGDEGYELVSDLDSLLEARWTDDNVRSFLVLLNDFNLATDFHSFYKDHTALYIKETKLFVDQAYGKVNMEWITSQSALKDFRCILSLSSGNYGALVNDTIAYACIKHKSELTIVHEFCHRFGNPLAIEWYQNAPTFQQLCDDSVDLERYPQYNHGLAMAFEYMAKAYVILYRFDQDQRMSDRITMLFIFAEEKKQGFTHIEEVFNMLLEYEKSPQ